MLTEKQGLKIKYKLLETGKTITELSKEMDVERAFLSGIINGSRNSKPIEDRLKEMFINKKEK